MKVFRGFVYLVSLIAIIAMPFVYNRITEANNPDIKVELKNEVENAIEIEDFDYKFEKFKSGLFSAAGAGGQGAAIMWMQTPESFIDNLQSGEKIFTELRPDDYYTTTKVYVAGVENRAHLLGYKEVYHNPAGYERVTYNDTEIVYTYDFDRDAISSLLLLFAIVGGVFWGLFGSFWAFGERDYKRGTV